MERDDRGDVRRVESVEFRGDGVRIEPLDNVRFGRAKGWGGDEDRLVGTAELNAGEDTGDICLGD